MCTRNIGLPHAVHGHLVLEGARVPAMPVMDLTCPWKASSSGEKNIENNMLRLLVPRAGQQGVTGRENHTTFDIVDTDIWQYCACVILSGRKRLGGTGSPKAGNGTLFFLTPGKSVTALRHCVRWRLCHYK